MVGIASCAALLAAVQAGALVARNSSLNRAVAALAPADRTVRLVWGGIGSGGENNPGEIDRVARRSVSRLAGMPVRAMLFRQSEANGHVFDLGAVDDLARFVHVRSGRLPQPCRPARCEVLQLGGSGPIPRLDGLKIVRVGRADLASTVPLGTLVTRETYSSVLSSALLYHTPATPPLLLAEGVSSLATVPALAPTYRSYSWTAPLAGHVLHPWTVDSFANAVQRTTTELEARSLAFQLSAPLDQIRSAQTSGRVAGRRLLVIGGEVAALLLAFAILAASGLRRDAEAEWRRLTWYGARRWQLVLVSAAEAAVLGTTGTSAGWAAGVGIGAYVADRAGTSAGGILAHSVLAGSGLAVAGAIAVAAAAVVLLSLRAGSARLGALTVTPVDVAAAGALVAVSIALARGAADASSLARERGTGAVLLVLPALIAFVAAVVAARVLAPGLRLLERRGRSGPVALRVAALSLARNPGRAAIAVAFLVVSLGLALFAAAYRATLERGQRDQAAFAVPADAIVGEDLTKLVPVLRAASLDRLRRIAPGVRVLPALRKDVDVRGVQTAQGGVTLLAIPADGLPSLRWRRDDVSRSPRALAHRLAPQRDVRLRGVAIPSDARELVLPLHVHGDPLAVRAVVITPFGNAVGLPLGTTPGRLAARVPADARGGLLVGLTFALANTGLHGVPNGGANATPAAQGTIVLHEPRVDGRPLPLDMSAWTGSGGIEQLGGARLRYVVTGEAEARFRARQATDGGPIPIVATRGLAAAAGPGGVLPLQIAGGAIDGRIVAIARRIPTVDGEAVLADQPTVTAALDATVPGAGVVDEVWLKAPHSSQRALAAALRRPPFDVLQVTTRAAVLHSLTTDPLARGTLVTLGAAALAALALALVGLSLVVVSDLRDERGELFDLEAQGAAPSELRKHLRVRSALVGTVGALAGMATGAILAELIVALVTLTAGAGTPQPPLRLGLDWPLALLGLAAFSVCSTLIVGIATGRAFRAEIPGRFAEAGS